MKATMVNSLRKSIDTLLKVDSVEIVLTPHTKTKKPGGVYDNTPQPARAPQLFQVEPSVATTTVDAAGGRGEGGGGLKAHLWTYVLTGKHDAQIEIGDTWQHGGTSYRVITIQPDNGYSKVAIASAIGSDPLYGS